MVLSRTCVAQADIAARLFAVAMCAAVLGLTGIGLQAAVPGTATLSGTVTASEPFTAAQVYARKRRPGHGVHGVHERGTLPGRGPVSRHLRGERQHQAPRVGRPDRDGGRRRRGRDRSRAGRARGRRALARHTRRPDRDGERRGGGVRVRELRRDLPAGAGQGGRRAGLHGVPRGELLPRPPRHRAAVDDLDRPHGRQHPRGAGSDPVRAGAALLPGVDRSASAGRTGTTCWPTSSRTSGPTASAGACAIEQQTPVDEEALGKAMYIEYYLAKDGPGEGVNDPAVGPGSGRPLRPGSALRRRRQRLAGGPAGSRTGSSSWIPAPASRRSISIPIPGTATTRFSSIRPA